MWNWKIKSQYIPFSQVIRDVVDEIDSKISRLCKRTQVGMSWENFFYVPKSDLFKFLMVVNVMFKHQVFLESKVPLS